MTIRELEPFAFGFKEADVSDIAPEYEREYRIACGFYCLCENARISIDPRDWFVGPGCTYPDLGIHYSRGSGMISTPAMREAQKERYPSLADKIDALYDEFEPIRTHRMTGGSFTQRQMALRSVLACWGEGGGHANPDYEMLLRMGTNGIRERIRLFAGIHNDKAGFYKALETALSALEVLADRYKTLADQMIPSSEGEDRIILTRISAALENVPRRQPRDFFEACQFFWLAYSFVENDSPGLFDYALGRYYEHHDTEDRYACLKKLWELFRRVRAWNLCIGRSDEFWNNYDCALTYDVLRVARELHYNTPNITMRFHRNSPERAWREAALTIGSGIGMPAVYNDEVVCPALEALGIPPSDTHLYCMNGCNQIDIFGKSHMGLEDGEISVIKALEFALFDGECQRTKQKLGVATGNAGAFSSFDDLLQAFYLQTDFLTDTAIDMSNKCQRIFAAEAPNPWHSLVIQGCIEKGLDYKNHGPYYGHGQLLTEGLPDAADCLAAIKHYVYDIRKYTMDELLQALKADYSGFDELQNDLKNWHKFGNDLDDVDTIYALITDHIYRYAQTKQTFRGGVFGFGCSTFERASRYGRSVCALPNGRNSEDDTLADSIGAVPGCDVNGPTALLNSVLKANQYLAVSGNVLQMKFSKSQFNTPRGTEAFISLAKTYFAHGGQTLQVNVLDAEELKKAKEAPEKYGDLIVRVGGFSTYFTKLEPGLQDNIIKRTEQQF